MQVYEPYASIVASAFDGDACLLEKRRELSDSTAQLRGTLWPGVVLRIDAIQPRLLFELCEQL